MPQVFKEYKLIDLQITNSVNQGRSKLNGWQLAKMKKSIPDMSLA